MKNRANFEGRNRYRPVLKKIHIFRGSLKRFIISPVHPPHSDTSNAWHLSNRLVPDERMITRFLIVIVRADKRRFVNRFVAIADGHNSLGERDFEPWRVRLRVVNRESNARRYQNPKYLMTSRKNGYAYSIIFWGLRPKCIKVWSTMTPVRLHVCFKIWPGFE